jgi:antitoxin component YwqK of YwqJK toxin-antitoxin module/tetratricopeptide (TPR) repeat protein
MNRILLATCLLISLTSYSQTLPPPYVPVADVFEQARELYDSAKYDRAIEKYQLVSKRDTAYAEALAGLALAYLSNKEYDKSLAACEEGLLKPSEQLPEFSRLKALAYERKGEFDKAVSLYEKALETYPLNEPIMYNLGLAYYNHKDYDKATAQFFKVLSIDPFHSWSHWNLGRIAAGQGKKTHALLSLGIYLSIKNDDNDRLVILNDVLLNAYKDEGSIPFSGENAFEKLDQIIRAGIAMDKKYKTTVPLDFAVVKQCQLFFEQISKADSKVNDPWYTFYMPVYQAVKDQDEMEPFVYHILTSTGNDQVRKWNQKNEKRLNSFFATTNTELKKKRQFITAPQLGYTTPVQAWYGGGMLEALGKERDGGVRQGHWIFFSNSVRTAEGDYTDEGKKFGPWKYYGEDGVLTTSKNTDTGETWLYKNGVLSEHFFRKTELTDGVVEWFNDCGALKEKVIYVQGKRHGKGATYFSSGKVSEEFTYENDLRTGESTFYYETGAIRKKIKYVLDKAEGATVEYYSNGRVSSVGSYKNNEPEGVWKYYHANGRLYRTGNFTNGVPNGEWTFYNVRGQITEKRMIDEKGKITGDDVTYHDGKPYNIETYKNDLLVKVTFYDEGGKAIASSGKNDGTFALKTYYPTGQLLGEGAYKKGKRDGRWKYYYPEGTVQSDMFYQDGKLQGESNEYFHTGQKMYVSRYKDNEREGLFEEFYVHGQRKQYGFFVAGNREQNWYTYHPDGSLESDFYYIHGAIEGLFTGRTVDGKIESMATYENDRMTDLTLFGPDEKPVSHRVVKDQTGRVNYESYHKNGKPQIRYETNCGEYTYVGKMFPDGKTLYDWSSLSGKREGPFKEYAMNGQLTREGRYSDGMAEGIWKAFTPDGTPDYSGAYLQDERDSTWTFNYFTGNIYYTREYLNNEPNGITRIFAPDGMPVMEKLYYTSRFVAFRKIAPHEKQADWTPFNGNQTLTATYPNGKTAYEEKFAKGVLDGPRKMYYSTGQLFFEYHFALGDFEGPYTIYFPDGKVEERGTYKFDERDGRFETFYPGGAPFVRETYRMGTLNGEATIYSTDGKSKTYHFYEGLPHD